MSYVILGKSDVIITSQIQGMKNVTLYVQQ